MDDRVRMDQEVIDKEMICIVCPVGCTLHITGTKDDLKISGNKCPKGIAYAKSEMINPTRVLPTTVKVLDGMLPRLPVKTEHEIPKALLFQAMEEINKVQVHAPVKLGDVIIENLLDTGVNVVATRDMPLK